MSELVIRNRQRARAIHTSLLRRIALHLLEKEFALTHYELGFHLIGSSEMARINKQFLQHEGSTDVITFDHGSTANSLHGELFISLPDALKQAREFKTTWQCELVRYVIHGLLHLRGFDDVRAASRRGMKREENRLLRAVQSRFAVREVARTRNLKSRTSNRS